MNKVERVSHRSLFDGLHIFALWGFAVAQPMYNLLGQNAEFFVAHRLGSSGILAFVAIVSFGLPLCLVLLEGAARRLSPQAQQWLHLVFVFGLTTTLICSMMARLPWSAYLTVACATLVGFSATIIYNRVKGVRSFVSLLSPGVLVFPAILLVNTPVSALVFPGDQDSSARASVREDSSIRNPAPVVFIVFDEFEAGALLDESRNIDPVRFPNFAALSRESWWFPYATSVRWDTPRALPAILTGIRPQDVQRPPTLESHPNNLFTWLADRYRFNVSEPLTSLCPRDLCRSTKAIEAEFDPRTFVSDIAILYLHIVLPAPVSTKLLPPMDGGWKGFAARKSAHNQDQHDEDSARNLDRRDQLEAFIKRIDSSDRNMLHFLHVLLPHTPYSYLPSGAMYPAGDAEGLVERRKWVNDEHLLQLAYHRNLLQIGFVDTFVGRLIARLKAIGLYDSALIVMTADHGKSFRTGQPTRSLTEENAPDLLQVPLFVKLPGQSEGRRSERRVLSIDILPTIAQALGTELPWRTDGVSMIGPTYPERDSIEIVVDGETTMRFAAAEVTSYPRLSWKKQVFGTRIPWMQTAVADQYSRLVGRKSVELAIEGTARGLEVVSNQIGLFDSVSLRSGVVPALLQGTIQGTTEADRSLHLAVALNGVVQVTTRTTNWAGSPSYFMAIMPEEAFREGANMVEAFVIQDSNGEIRLSPVRVAGQEQLTLSGTAPDESLVANARRIGVRAGVAKGIVDRVERHGEWVTLQGWSVDAELVRPASRVIVLANGRQVFSGFPNASRPDLERVFGRPEVRDGAFRFALPKSAIGSGPIRVFGISRSGVASELDWKPGAQADLRQVNN